MVISQLTTTEFVGLFEEHGWEVASNDYFDGFDRIILSKNGETYVMKNEPHLYPEVIRVCEMFDMQAPDHCIKARDQWKEYLRRKAEKEQVEKNKDNKKQ